EVSQHRVGIIAPYVMRSIVLATLLLVCMAAAPLYAQNTAEVRGIVVDRTLTLRRNTSFDVFDNKSGNIHPDAKALLPVLPVPYVDAVPLFTTTNILLAPNTGSVGGSGLMYKYRSEYAESWTLSVQRSFRTNWALMATYLGSRVVGADNSTYFNVPEPGPGPID